jgi:hypothetical protein
MWKQTTFEDDYVKLHHFSNVIAEDVGKIFTTPVNEILAISIVLP